METNLLFFFKENGMSFLEENGTALYIFCFTMYVVAVV